MLALALACALASAVVEAPTAPKLLALDVTATGVTADDGKALDRLIVAELAAVPAVAVVSAEEIRRLAELDASRQAMGCDDASCLAEIAGAMGARLVVFGTVSKLGDKTTLTLSLYDDQQGGKIVRETATVDGGVDALAPYVQPVVRRLLAQAGLDVPLAVDPPPSSTGPGPLVWLGGAALGVGLLATAGAGVVVGVMEADVQTPPRDGPDKARSQLIGLVALGGVAVGAVVAVAGGVALAVGLAE